MQNTIRHQVFVSSTFVDLQDERRKISEALLKLDCIPAGMELFPATDEEQFSFIKRIIDACDYYIVIIGGRYGTLTKEGISFTEKEYRYARDQGIPVLAFLHDDPESIAAGKSDLDPMLREKLLAFRTELQSNRIVTGWSSSDDLVTKIILAVVNARGAHPRPGWVRGNEVASSAVLSALNEENANLRAHLTDLEKQTSTPIELGYDPDDCNSKQGQGSISLSLGGKWTRVNQGNLHVARLRCTNPTLLDLRDCSGHLTAVERLAPSGAWEPLWNDAVNLVWSHTQGEVSTTIPAKGTKYLDVFVLSFNDLPVLKAKDAPHDLYNLFQNTGHYRLRGCVSSHGGSAVEFELHMEYTATTHRVVVKMGEMPPPRKFPKIFVSSRPFI